MNDVHLDQWTVTLPYLKTDNRLAFVERAILMHWRTEDSVDLDAKRNVIGAVKNLRKAVRLANAKNVRRAHDNVRRAQDAQAVPEGVQAPLPLPWDSAPVGGAGLLG